jgi:nucleoside-diphosphate-sugar epimerase
LKFTVFGSTGFIGSHLVAALRARGEECVTPSRDDEHWRGVSLGRVIYAIGLTADFRSRPIDTVRAHVSRVADVLEHAQYESFTYLSATRVYSGAKLGVEETAFEVDPRSMSDLYNLSKLMGESLVLARAGDRAHIVRLSNVYGADWQSENFLTSIVRDAIARRSVVIRTSPESSKDYISIDDAVSLIAAIAARGTRTIYNVASGRNVTNEALANALAAAAGAAVTFEPGAPTVTFPAIDISRIREEFGAPRGSLIDDLPRLVAGFARTEATR